MSGSVIVPIVEGQAEVESVPILLRRLLEANGHSHLVSSMARPFRVKRARVVKEGELEKAIEVARRQRPGAKSVLVLLDADDDCPAELGPRLSERAMRGHGDLVTKVVLAKREFEAWFLCALESLRGARGIPHNAVSPANPEGVRGAKEKLSRIMEGNRCYLETVDQPKLSAVLDLEAACQNSPSFDKFRRVVRQLAERMIAQDL